MASGCTSNGSSLSSECLQPISDKCVKYTGPAIPALGICTGDTLNELEAVLLDHVLSFSKGLGIMISGIDLAACNLFTNYITCCNGPSTVSKELTDLIKMIFTALCALNTRLTTVETTLADLFTGPYYTACLAGLSANPTFKQIIQALLIKVCELDSRLTILETAFATLNSSLGTTIGNFLLAHINSCQSGSLVKSGSGAGTNLQLLGFAPIGTIMAFDGDISMFDGTGLGRTNSSACGWALCNGNNGTKNMQGLGVMGTTTMLTSPPAAADGGIYAHGVTGGKVSVTLNSTQIPSVGVTGTTTPAGTAVVLPDVFQNGFKSNTSGNNGVGLFSDGPLQPSVGLHVNLPALALTGSTGGGGGSHENLPPYIALEWIKRIA